MAIIILPVIDTDALHWTFNTPTDALATILSKASVTTTSLALGGGVQLINDSTSPGVSKYYGTDTSGTKGFITLPIMSAVTGLHVQGQTTLTGDVTLVQGVGITLSQAGQLITIANNGVTSLLVNGVTSLGGQVSLQQGSNVTITNSGQTITFAASGGGGGGGGLVLVENKNIAANTTSVTFAGLDGNTDGAYLLIGKWLVNGGSGSNTLTVNPNGSSSSTSYERLYNGGNDGGSTWLVGGGMSNGDRIGFTWHIQAKTNNQSTAQPKYFQGQCIQDNGGTLTIVNIGGKLNDTVNNLTSLDVTSNLTNGIGQGSQFSLYKFAQA